ncbi:GAK system ATP-grasp enzyme [Desulfomicrobium salsuginis]
MKIGVVGTRGGWSSELLADTVAARTGYRLLVDMEQVCLDLDAGSARFQGVDLAGLDGLIVKKIGARYSPDLLDRLELLRFLAERGLPIFSAPLSIMRVLDRLSCTVTLRLGGIPMPPTTITESVDEALAAVGRYGEAVFKPLFTSKARGMTVIAEGPAAREAVEAFHAENPIMYLQQKIELPGQDLGIVFLGGNYMTTYARCGTGAWNTTTESGGRYASAVPSPEALAVAQKAQALFDLDFTCVDVVETAAGPVVFEVSAFGGFRGIQEACGLDAAAMYTDYVMEKIRGS